MTNLFMKAAALASFAVLCANSTNAADTPSAPVLAKELARARGGFRINVTSNAFLSGESLDERYTQNGENMSPPIAWTKGPSGTISYAILMEDADVKGSEPATHWIVYDIPGTRTRISEHQPAQNEIEAGAMQGVNVAKTVGFIGPKPPAGET